LLGERVGTSVRLTAIIVSSTIGVVKEAVRQVNRGADKVGLCLEQKVTFPANLLQPFAELRARQIFFLNLADCWFEQ
jgi:hypothetical protein